MDVTSYLLGKKAGGGGSEPTGAITITSNGTHNVKSYASAIVDVEPDLETKSVTITENTTTTITPTQGKDGISSVEVTTNVPTGITPTGTINITENGTHDVTNYASASVNVSGGGSTPETLEEVNYCLNNYFNYIQNLSNSYEAISSEAKTLYTPNANRERYVIYKTSNGQYRIGWASSTSSNIVGIAIYLSGGNYSLGVINMTFVNKNIKLTYANDTFSRSTNEFATIEACITAMQDNTTTYEEASGASAKRAYDQNAIVLSNSGVFYYSNSSSEGETKTPQRISSNETIEVIQSS